MDFMCLNFINSQWYINHKPFKDPLRNKKWIDKLVKELGFVVDLPVSDKEIEELFALRKLFSDIIDSICKGKDIAWEQIEEINHYLSLNPLYYELKKEESKFSVFLKPVKNDWNSVFGKITASFIDLLSMDDVKNIKKCENPECKWIFYDRSKNHTRRWCCNTCASLVKVRRFREKKSQCIAFYSK